MSQDQVLEILQSLGRQLQIPPHYPVRLISELADELGISFSQARRLRDFLEKENLIRYNCSFEAENEDQNKTVLEINSSRDFSPAFA
jgi:predicted ArsR family transcriptional regulator